MMKIPLCITKDNEGDYHVSVPHRIPTLPKGKFVMDNEPNALVTIAHLHEVIDLYKDNNQKRVNEILSSYFKPNT